MKFEHRPHRYEDGTIRIGGEIYGIAAEIADPYGWAWTALTLMDGTRSHDEIIERLRLAHPELPDPESIVEQLAATRYVEDAAAAPPAGLSERERDRYSRNHAFFRTVDIVPRGHGWETQLRLKSARVVVLGLGGTGCHAAWALAAVGVGAIHCVDPDLVELSNLNRQVLYGEGDVGRPKAEAAVARLRSVNSDISVTGERRHIGSRRELDELIAGYDALALCADRPTGHDIRVWANRACAAAGIPWAGGGYNGPLVTVGCFAPGAGACYECLSSGEEARRHPGTPVDLGGPGVIATSAGVSGQLVAHALLGLLTGVPVPPVGTIQGVNLIAADHHVWVRHPPLPGCPVCGTRADGPEHNSTRRMTEIDAGRTNRSRP
ncbi:HesA/MoeB/ThiF family protein [Microbispora bryophytorum]|uniref:ThiF family adenylyltransferase n=1 Tax=Microbispora bryophytorum subsp. camponoti TaxID=1677852 RepID=A0ABR8L136_9ACTN|nr:ThiF family adenylyltransferase [Microbispora camponoti]MBD3143115.1 ThiF family adenylyltransferase [Microbispora camponoti]